MYNDKDNDKLFLKSEPQCLYFYAMAFFYLALALLSLLLILVLGFLFWYTIIYRL